MNQFSRTQLLLGKGSISSLQEKHVIVFGIGGVGGYVAESLARSGVGKISVVDNDLISETNINRQIIALHSTLGKKKTQVIKERLLDISPTIQVIEHDCFFLPENKNEFDFSQYDFVIDCVDTVTAKIAIIQSATDANVPVITCMGTGNKTDPMGFLISNIEKTSVCPLAKVMRHELKARGIKGVKCVYSKEIPKKIFIEESLENKEKITRHPPASVCWTPAAAGFLLSSYVIQQLIN